MPNVGTKAKRVASITNRPTCGGNTKAGLTPSVGVGYAGGSISASMSRASNRKRWPVKCLEAIEAGMPLNVNSMCSGGVGNTKKSTACKCSRCFARDSKADPGPPTTLTWTASTDTSITITVIPHSADLPTLAGYELEYRYVAKSGALGAAQKITAHSTATDGKYTWVLSGLLPGQ